MNIWQLIFSSKKMMISSSGDDITVTPFDFFYKHCKSAKLPWRHDFEHSASFQSWSYHEKSGSPPHLQEQVGHGCRELSGIVLLLQIISKVTVTHSLTNHR